MFHAMPRHAFAAALGFAACTAATPLFADDLRVAQGREESEDGEKKGKRKRAASEAGPWQGGTINVTAKGTADDVPSALATDVVHWDEAVGEPADFQDLIVRVPGVGATGQNGLFETFSIRGSGANGILILVGGMPITAQRRAGVPVSFVEPALLGDISVTRGPAVVHYGPGALGGAVSVEPRWFDAPYVAAGYATSGDETNVSAALGSDSFSFAVARHEADASEASGGAPLNTGYERLSATAQYRARLGEFDFDALLLPSRTVDIGKSNSRYPDRNTTYPEDSHTLGRMRLRHDNGFSASVYAHDQYLGTWNRRPGNPDTFAAVSSTDIGATVQQRLDVGAGHYDIGVEYLGRRDVDAYDARVSVLNRTYSLRNARENGWSLFALGDWQLAPSFELEVGGRYSRVSQEQRGADADDSDSAFTAGAVWRPDDAQRVSLSTSTGYRFATLEERYFSGVTAQGEIAGNPDLRSEHSRGVDVGYAWHAGPWGGEAHVWRNVVDDLIQLHAVAQGVNGYENVARGHLHGAEALFGWGADGLTLRAGATWVRGHDDSGVVLYGLPPVTAEFEAKYEFGGIDLGTRFSHRWKVDRPGFEETARHAVDVVDADLRWRFAPSWSARLYVRNAFNEKYFATSDVLSALAQERSVGVDLRWTLH